jgi:cytochrome b
MVWDLPVRAFHWALAVAVAASYFTHTLGIQYFRYHVWCGYSVIVLVIFRIAWGFVGTRHARFSSFVRGPAAAWRYLSGRSHDKERRYAGHNPVGGWMVLVLLAILLVQAVTGLFGNDEIADVGPLYGLIGNDWSLRLTSLHRRLFDWIAVAIALHVAAVLAYRIVKKRNLITPMLTGSKPATVVPADQAIPSSRIWLALSLLALICSVLAVIVAVAPAAEIGSY